MQVLEDLYLGDIHPSERSFKKDSQYSRALNEAVKAGDALLDTLTEKQREYKHITPTAQALGSRCNQRHSGRLNA